MERAIDIKPLKSEDFDDFFIYLKDHISDNGANNTPLFLPISRNDLILSKPLMDSFRDGASISTDTLGWRRVLVALNSKKEIIGHIDLKSHNQNYTNHRAIIGMGVHRDYRKMGVGYALMASLIEWAKNETTIEQVDLWVLSENGRAMRLYEQFGFQKIGVIEDMFRIDGDSLNYIMMTKAVLK